MNPKSVEDVKFNIVRREAVFDNPYLRHFIKKHALPDSDAVVLGILLDLTHQMKTPIKTTYGVIAASADMPAMEVYRSVDSLHRFGIIEYKPDHAFVHISFRELDESVEEIALAYINARKIKVIENELARIRKKNYVPADDLFDLMYPIIGRLVARKIADALRSLVNYIDRMLNTSLSFSMWRCRYIAFRTKLPLAEIILRQSLPFLIDEVFLIDKKSSLVMAHVSRLPEETADSDLVGGMLSAINDFIATSFKKKGAMASEIQFGESRIVIAESVYFFAAFVVSGSYGIDFLEEVESLLASIHAGFRKELKNFRGDMESVEGIEPPLLGFMNAKNTPPARQDEAPLRKVKIAGALIAAVAATAVVYNVYAAVRDYRIERRIEARLAAALPPGAANVRLDVNGGRLRIEGYAGSSEAVEALNREVRAFKEIKTVDNRAIIVNFIRVKEQEDTIRRLESQIRTMQVSVARQDLEQIVIQFPTNVAAIGNAESFQVKRAFEIMRQYPLIQVRLVAFADPSGGPDVNKRLAHARMEAVKNHLVALGVQARRISIRDFDPGLLESDPKMSRFRDRRGIMLFAESQE